MQNFTYTLFLLLITFLTACSASKEEKSVEQVQESSDKVEITLPAAMFEGDDIDAIIENAKKNGILEVIKNEDGSLTYKMSEEKHRELMKETGKGITDSITDMKNSGTYSSVKDIAHNDSFSEFTLLVDKKVYGESMDSFAAFSLGMSGMMYQLFNGTDHNKVTVFVKDEDTQEVFDEIVYPDALE